MSKNRRLEAKTEERMQSAVKVAGQIAGMIGGLGPESTAVYYRRLIEEYRKAKQDGSYPSILVNSLNMQRMLGLLIAADHEGVVRYLLKALEQLAVTGATFGFISANAPHLVFDELESLSPIPLISIVKAACTAAKQTGRKRLGLIGARFTMQAAFYPKVFSGEGLTIVTPDAKEQDYIHEKYLGELVNGLVVPETRQELLKIMERLKVRGQIDGVILGGTELSLLFDDDTACGMPLLDTTKIHVQAVVAQMLE
jgi:aspartate racemase